MIKNFKLLVCAESNGYTIDQVKAIATAQGVSNSDIIDFEKRLNKLLNLQTADLMIDSEEPVSSLIIQSESELSAETGLALFGKDFFIKSSLETTPQLNMQHHNYISLVQEIKLQ